MMSKQSLEAAMAVSFRDNEQGICTSDFETDETTDGSNAPEGGVDSESDTASVAVAVHPIHSSGVASGTSAFVQIKLASGEAARVVSEILDMDPVSYDDNVEKFEENSAAALDRSVGRVVDLVRQNLTAAAIRIQGFDFGPLFPTAEARCSHRTQPGSGGSWVGSLAGAWRGWLLGGENLFAPALPRHSTCPGRERGFQRIRRTSELPHGHEL